MSSSVLAFPLLLSTSDTPLSAGLGGSEPVPVERRHSGVSTGPTASVGHHVHGTSM